MSKKRWLLIILALLIGITAACFVLPKKIGSDCQKEIEECRDYVEENELKCICPTDCKEYENGNPFCGEDNNTSNEVIEKETVEDESSISDNCKKEQEKCFELQRNGYDIMCAICPGDYGLFPEEEILDLK